MRLRQRAFELVFGGLLLLAALPLWLPRLLPMQDYPQILVLARAHGDCVDPTSPFFGNYERGTTFGPLLLPVLLLRGIGFFTGLETAGRILWTAFAIGLPLAALYLLRVTGRDRWSALLVFPLVYSYWTIGGFFAFATSAPLLVLAVAFTVRWLRTGEILDGVGFVVLACSLHLWHALAFAELMLAFSVLWLLARYESLRDRADGLLPLAAPLILFASWLVSAVLARRAGTRSAVWSSPWENAEHVFDYLGPVLPNASVVALAFVGLFAVFAVATSAPAEAGDFRVKSPLVWLAAVAALLYFVLPASCFGVEGINNRQPWMAAIFLAIGYRLPRRPALRAAFLGLASAGAVVVLGIMAWRFEAFDEESIGASRLIDRLGPGETLLSPPTVGALRSFPPPAKPLVAAGLYAAVRHGVLPESSFAGYDVNIVRYANGRDPMPALGASWRKHLDRLRRYDYVLLRGPNAMALPPGVVFVAGDGEWRLFGVCGSQSRPVCH